MSVLISQFISLPPPFLPGNHKFVFSICDSYFCFINKFICTIFLDFTYKWYHMLFIFLWLTSLIMTIFRSICVAADGTISFFFMAE